MIKHIIGDLLKQPLDAFVQQSNCFCTMGSGIAKSIREKYPEVYKSDCRTTKGDKGKLGGFSFAKTHDGKIGYNLYSQFDYGSDGKQYTNYEAMREGLIKIKQHAKLNIGNNAKIGLPYNIGCTRGGGSWNEVLKIIEEVFSNDTIELVICEFREYSSAENDHKEKLRAAYKKANLSGDIDNNEE